MVYQDSNNRKILLNVSFQNNILTIIKKHPSLSLSKKMEDISSKDIAVNVYL